MPKAKLDYAYVSTAECEPGRTKTDYYDQTVTGFVLECRSTGGKTYYLRYADAAGRQKQHKIGKVEDVTFAAAKKKAQHLRSEVVMGQDPAATKALAKAIPRYSDIAADHLTYARLHLRAHDSVEMNLRVHLIPRFGKMRVNDISRVVVAQWLAEKRSAGLAPATVEKLRAVLSRSYELASQAGVEGCEKNPARGFPRKPLNNARTRYLSQEEAVRLHAAVAESQNPQLKHIIGLLLGTGVRLRELLDARWENVDIERRSLFIPDSKTGKTRYVPLSSPVLAIITALPLFDGCPWLVPNPDTRKPYVSIKTGFQRAIRVANLPGLRIHDLRHSYASNLVSAGIDLYAVGKILGHANVASSARYSHLSNATLLAAVEAGAAKQAAA